jgi:hypothetical protein
MATKALGVESGDEGALAAAVASGDPSVLVKLKEVDANFKLELKRMDIELEQINASDRNSARDLAKAKGVQPQVILSTVYTVGYFWLLWAMLMGEVIISPDVKGLINTLMGVMTAAQVQIMNFWFGSSAGSKAKTDQMSAHAK